MQSARFAVIAAAALLTACSSAPPESTTTATAQPVADAVPLPASRAPAARAPATAAAAVRPQQPAPGPNAAQPQAAPGSLIADRGQPSPASASNSLFQNGNTGSLPGVAQPPAPGAVGGMELRGALPASAEPAPTAAGTDLPGVAAPPPRVGSANSGATPPPDQRYGANPPSAATLRGSWRLRTTSSNVSCTISVSPADQLSSGAVSAQKECLAYGALNRFELRGRDLLLIDPFGETARLQPLGSYWQGRGKNGEGIILQR